MCQIISRTICAPILIYVFANKDSDRDSTSTLSPNKDWRQVFKLNLYCLFRFWLRVFEDVKLFTRQVIQSYFFEFQIPIRRPRSPMTSPIESSSDEMESSKVKPDRLDKDSASSMSASDISDTDFACQSEGEGKESNGEEPEPDLEELEKARAELQVNISQ